MHMSQTQQIKNLKKLQYIEVDVLDKKRYKRFADIYCII